MEFIPAIYYQNIYTIFVALLTFFVLERYGNFSLSNRNIYAFRGKPSLAWLYLAVFVGLFIGFRPDSHVFIDMMGTIRMWNYRIANASWDSENFLYDQIPSVIHALGGSHTSFFVIMALFYFIGTGYACRRLFSRHVLIAFLVWMAAFSTFSYTTNGVKAGSAATWFLLALSFHDNKKIAIPLLVISLGFHHSMKLPIAIFLLCCYVKNPKYYLGLWLVSLIFSAAHITSVMEWLGDFLANSADDAHGADYLLGGQEFVIKKGFRIDFLFYSAVPVLLGYWAIFKRNVKSPTYIFLWNVYVGINSFWLLCMYSSFTNRVAYLSWLMYPIVLIYPFLHEHFCKNQTKVFKIIVLLHLAFSLLMFFVYY